MVFTGMAYPFFSKILHQNFLLVAVFILETAGFALFILNQSTISIYIFLALYGISGGASTPLFILILGSYFGRKAFGSIFGSSMAMCAPVSLFAPVFSGWIFDTTGSYLFLAKIGEHNILGLLIH